MSKKTIAISAGAATAVAALAIGGFAVSSFLSGGGIQPEDVLPDSTVAFVKVDLDPSAGQKLNVYKLSKHFDEVDASSADDVKDAILAPNFDNQSVDYDADIKPWLGDRAAVAAVPHDDEVEALMAVEFTDEVAMTNALTDLAGDDGLAWSVKENFVLIGEGEAFVNEAAKATSVLADDSDFKGDISALGGDQIVTGWVDVERAYEFAGDDAESILNAYGASTADAEALDVKPTGSVVLGLNAQSDHIEMVAKTLDFEGETFDFASAFGTGMTSDFPADTVAAVSLSSLGESFAALYDALELDLADMTESDVELPADLKTLLGTDLAVGLRILGDGTAEEDLDLFGKVRTDNPARAVELVDMLAADAGEIDANATALDDDHYGITMPGSPTDLGVAGGLGDSKKFKTVVADPDANMVGFFDIGTVLDIYGGNLVDPDEAADLLALDAFGLSVKTEGSDATITARLSVR